MYSTVKYRSVFFGIGNILSCLYNVITMVIFRKVCTISVYCRTNRYTRNVTKLILKLLRYDSVLLYHHILYNITFLSILYIHYRF